MRVLLDSNVIIAAFATRGLCKDLFELCLENHTIILSQELLEEIKKNLKKKIRLSDKIAHEILDYLQSIATLETVSKKIDSKVCRDPDDVKVLELAAQAVPDCMVSGDCDLLVPKKFEGIPIVSPREFWEYLAKRKSKK